MDTYRTETVNAEGLRLSQIIWRLWRRQPAGYLEEVLAANPGLASAGPIVPVGTVIRFPMIDVAAKPDVEKGVRLWD